MALAWPYQAGVSAEAAGDREGRRKDGGPNNLIHWSRILLAR
jgi:hypothetical protein